MTWWAAQYIPVGMPTFEATVANEREAANALNFITREKLEFVDTGTRMVARVANGGSAQYFKLPEKNDG